MTIVFAVSAACPSRKTLETGLCEKGYRTDIVFEHSRDKKNRCRKFQKSVMVKCAQKEVGCPHSRTSKIKGCVHGVQRYLRVYFVYGSRSKRCRRKFEQFEKACGGRSKNNCPSPRVVEPGMCAKGQLMVTHLIEHYEYR